MNLHAAIATATNPKSTPLQLEKVVGRYLESDRLVAKHPNATEEILFRLSRSLDEDTRKNISQNLKAPLKTRIRMLLRLKINKNNVLVGDIDKELDLRDIDLNLPFQTFSNEENNLKHSNISDLLTEPDICICGSDSLERLQLPCDYPDFRFALIENLPNLKEIIVSHTDSNQKRNDALKWLLCRNLPSLESITVDGNVFWLKLENLVSLKSIATHNNSTLDYFSITNTPSLNQINVNNCTKLQEILGLPANQHINLDIENQIFQNQQKSRKNGIIYQNMTSTDVNLVLESINSATKTATQKGLVSEDFCYVQEGQADFKKFSINLLNPLEVVFNGGTGEINTYELLIHDFDDNGAGVEDSEGCQTQEECLESALKYIASFWTDIPSIFDLDKDRRRRSQLDHQIINKEVERRVQEFYMRYISEVF